MREDELLQEVKSMHPQLIDFLAQSTSIARLVEYLVKGDDSVNPALITDNSSDEDGIEFTGSSENCLDETSNSSPAPLVCSKCEEDRPTTHGYFEGCTGQRTPAMESEDSDRSNDLENTQNAPFFIEEDVSNDDDDNHSLSKIRFPYMACEIVCCENSRIIDILISGKNEKGETLLDRFFSILELPPGKVDDRHAGYFEKIISVLLRIRAKPLMEYINQQGIELFNKFINHLDNYSIMQVLERLMLPSLRIPDDDGTGNDCGDIQASKTDGSEDDTGSPNICLACDWGENVAAMSLLVDKMIEDDSPDHVVATHAAELLVSCVHQKPLASPILQRLTTGTVLQKIVRKASVLGEGEAFTSHDTGMTSALLLLESIVLQLGGFGCVAPVDDSLSISFISQSAIANRENSFSSKTEASVRSGSWSYAESNPQNLASANDLIALLPGALSMWDALLTHEVTKSWFVMNQMGKRIPMVGTSRLRIVRLIEALVLLAHPIVDEQLVKSNSIRHCLDLFFEFEWCSMLHQSVANLVVHVLEREGRRVPLQLYLINDLGLLERLLSAYEKSGELYTESSEKSVHFRLGFLGHVIIICQAIVHACSITPQLKSSVENIEAGSITPPSSVMMSDEMQSDKVVANEMGHHEPTALASAVLQSPTYQRWSEFVLSTLAVIIAVQATPLGGSSPPTRGGEGMNNNDDEVLQMNENELDIAVTMIEAMNLPCEYLDDDEYERDFETFSSEHRKKMASDASLLVFSDFHFGEKQKDYCFDDPLGRTDRIDDGEIDSKDVMLEEDDDSDVPVLDLFAGNFGVSSDVFPDADEAVRSPQNDAIKENGVPFFFADFDNCQPSNNKSMEGDAVKDFAAFGSNFDHAFTTVMMSDKDDTKNEAIDAQRKVSDPFDTTKFNIDDIF